LHQESERSKQARFGFRNWDLSLWVCFGFRCAGKNRQGVVNESFIR
jgi:hypothetical protein